MLEPIQSTIALQTQPAADVHFVFTYAALDGGSVRDSAALYRVPTGVIRMSHYHITRSSPIKIVEWRPFRRNTLRGFVTVDVGFLKIIDVLVHARDQKNWCSLPAKVILNPDGTARRTPAGRLVYSQLLQWTEKQAETAFSQSVWAELERDYPDTLLPE